MRGFVYRPIQKPAPDYTNQIVALVLVVVIMGATAGALFGLGVFDGGSKNASVPPFSSSSSVRSPSSSSSTGVSSSSSSSSALYSSSSSSSSSSSLPAALVAGVSYQIASAGQCLQSSPTANATQPSPETGPPLGTALSLTACSAAEPAQYWLYTPQGALSLAFADAGVYHSYLSTNGPCNAGVDILIVPTSARTPSSVANYSNGQLTLCGYCVTPGLKTAASCPTAAWSLLPAVKAPGAPLVAGEVLGFEYYPALDSSSCYQYQEVAYGFAFTRGGVVRLPCTTRTAPSGSPDGAQYAFLDAGWMNATIAGLTPGASYTVSFALAVAATSNAQPLAVYLGGQQAVEPTSLGAEPWTRISPQGGPGQLLQTNPVVVTTSAATLSFVLLPGSGAITLFLDSISVSPS